MRVLHLTLTEYPDKPTGGKGLFRVHAHLSLHMLKGFEDGEGVKILMDAMEKQLDAEIAKGQIKERFKPMERPDYDERTLPEAKR